MVRHIFIQGLCAYCFLILLSCSNRYILDEMERIKSIGDDNPNKALVMLDSLEIKIRKESDYAKHKYDLLRIRLNDKADKIPTSDIMIKQLVKYFTRKGSFSEKQEVYYYAGSVYRDLQDTPRALEYFFKSLDYADDCEGCDSVMLRNTYSNLAYLYYRVQNFHDAANMALKELEICKKIKRDETLPYMHLGAAYLALDSVRMAESAFDTVYSNLINSQDISLHQNTFIHLLNNYSQLKNKTKAEKCLSIVKTNPIEDSTTFACLVYAQYYELQCQNDSAIYYCKQILDDGTDMGDMYDAAKLLYRIYSREGDIQNASRYAGVYMQLSDSLDFGKRQELAATVNNEFKYHLDQKKEQDLKDEKERYKNTLIIVSFAALLLASIGYIFYVRGRNKHLQMVVGLSSELQRITNDDRQLRGEIHEREMELANTRVSLEKSYDELDNVKHELQRVNDELAEYDEALKAKEKQLTEKMEQNKTFIKLLHQSELEGKAEDVIHAIRQSSTGKKDMKPADWKQLYQAVDELYPTFKDRLLTELGNFTEQQMQVCYLMRIGLSKPQIQNMTNLSRVTVWRWVKKYDWVLSNH